MDMEKYGSNTYNARVQLADVAEWLGWQDESFSFGLRSSLDALRLYDYAQAHPELPEMAEEWETEDLEAAIGYDPMGEREAIVGRSVGPTGAAAAFDAMKRARDLIDSVAYISIEGDKDDVLTALDSFVAARPQVQPEEDVEQEVQEPEGGRERP